MSIEVQRQEKIVGNLRGSRIQTHREVRWVIIKDGKNFLSYKTRREARKVAQSIGQRS